MKKKKVTLQMIADRAGVSVVTISNVLSGKKGASEELRKLVFALADEMGYSGPAKAQEKTASFCIGVMIAERYVKECPSYYMNLYKQIAQEAVRRGCLTVLEVVDRSKECLNGEISVFGTVEVQGILLIGELEPSFVEQVNRCCSQPVVCVEFYDIEKDLDFIVTDNFSGMQMVTRSLISDGHRKIAFFGTPQSDSNVLDRYMGYCKTMQEQHLPVMEPVSDQNQDGQELIDAWILRGELPEAFVCSCEQSAYLLAEQLLQKGVKIPEDVSIAAYDRFFQIGPGGLHLNSFVSDEQAIARISIGTLVKRMEGKSSPTGIRMVEGVLREGNSVRKRGE